MRSSMLEPHSIFARSPCRGEDSGKRNKEKTKEQPDRDLGAAPVQEGRFHFEKERGSSRGWETRGAPSFGQGGYSPRGTGDTQQMTGSIIYPSTNKRRLLSPGRGPTFGFGCKSSQPTRPPHHVAVVARWRKCPKKERDRTKHHAAFFLLDLQGRWTGSFSSPTTGHGPKPICDPKGPREDPFSSRFPFVARSYPMRLGKHRPEHPMNNITKHGWRTI